MKKSVLFGVLIVAMLFGAVGLASANVVTYTGAGSPLSASGTVNVAASVNPKITLTIDTPDAAQTVDFGAIDPETAYTDSVDLRVKSNQVYDLTVGAPAGDVAELGFTNDLASAANQAKGVNNYVDNYGVNAPFTTDPGVYGVTVQYTVAQQ